MRFIYTILFYLAMPLILLRLVWKSRRLRGYRQRIPERFGFSSFQEQCKQNNWQDAHCIWVHAVSVGEVIAAVPLIKGLQQAFSTTPIILTTTTPTGSDRAKALFNQQVIHSYLPYDIPGAIKRFIKQTRPKGIIVMETEIWPNFLTICKQQNIPLLLANARLSPRSAKQYQKFPGFMRKTLRHISLIAAQSQHDAARFLALGATKAQLRITGNIKFDIQIPASTHEKAALFQSLWGNKRLIWVAASTHEGEEEHILKAYTKILKQLPNTLLVLVPRHPERFNKVAALCKKQGFETILRSENRPCTLNVQIFLGDSMGELAAFYAASDIAYVGGSLVPIGGHNLLEPAALGIAAITGPYVFNFTEITDLLLQAHAIKQIKDENELAETVVYWLQNSQQRIAAGKKGQEVVTNNRGSVEAHLALFRGLLA